jgi:surfeit locus 1 family protein
MVRTLFTRRWMLRHLLILVAVAACITAGFWQLHRRAERRARNDRIATQSALGPLRVTSAPPVSATLRRVEASGRYDAGHEIVLLDRPLDDRPGVHRLTPLVFADGSALLVDRGWIPEDLGSEADRTMGPSGPVKVSGVLLPPERPRPMTPKTAPTGSTVQRIDTAGLGPRFPYRLASVYLLLASQQPAQLGPLPVVVPPPVPEPGPPHLSYAIQWFSFAAIALGGHLILARRALRGRA